jgi:NAD(P)-dependent dehydrogenase (short-subunit alcohol dehydrogenase family)
MAYLVTGGTGFIGRHVLAELITHGEPVHVLVRPESRSRLDSIARDLGSRGRLITAVEGDLCADLARLAPPTCDRLRGDIRHFIHLAALYDLGAEAAALERSNVEGTRHALQLAHELKAGCFHLVSSIAVAGRYRGTFTEQMFEQAQDLDHPYFRTKHESEALVRATCRIPWRIYRPGMVVGHSTSGSMDKIDGPYYLFKLIQKVRDNLPQWLPLVGFEGGHINLVPVDFVARALVHLVHAPGQDGKCFHLTDPVDRRIGETINLFAKAAHAPGMTVRLQPGLLHVLGAGAGAAAQFLQPLNRLIDQVLREFGIPKSVVTLLNFPTVFDSTHTQELLAGAGIQVPRLEDYAWRLWDYWERCLDPDLFKARHLRDAVLGKKVLITGGSSGIGRATAIRLAQSGAHVLIVARDADKLSSVAAEIESRGGHISKYNCDIADSSACERFIAEVLAEHGHIDILINNAGRSIRRAVENTYVRLHDYERLMRINYFAAVQVTLGFLPSMVLRGSGHVIGISSIGAITYASRFAAYNASKAALEGFLRCAAAEYRERGVHFTVVNMPLVRTPMVAPTKMYDSLPLIQPDQAADLVCDAIIRRPERLATRLGALAQFVESFAPWLNTAIMSESFRMFPESEAAGGPREAHAQSTPEWVAFASLMRGIHW